MEKNKTTEFQDYINANETGEIQLTSKIRYKIRDVIEKNDQMFNGKFVSPKDGTFTKIYYNIGFIIFRSVYQVLVASVGTKDIQERSLNGKGIKALALVKMAIHTYLTKIGFGKFINDLVYFLKDGTLITKVVDGKPYIVRNANIVRDWSGGTIQETGIAEKKLYSWSDMLSHEEDWKDSWERIKALKAIMDKEKVKDFVVYEWWSEFDFDGKTHKGCKIMLDLQKTTPSSRTKTDRPTEWQPDIELEKFITTRKKRRTSKREIEKLGEWEELYPYKELDFIKCPGRGLAFSVFELVDGPQTAYNRKMNLHDRKDIFGLMGVYKHIKNSSSPSIAQNLLNNIESGKVVEMEMGEDLQQVITDVKTGEMLNNVNNLFELARLIIGVTAQGAGIDMPATTTATVGVLNKQTQKTTYDYAAEQMAIFLTELFNDFLFEDILNEIDSEEINMIVGDPTALRELDAFFIDNHINSQVEEAHKKFMNYPVKSSDEVHSFYDNLQITASDEKSKLAKEFEGFNDARWVNIKKELLKELNASFEFYVNNEGFDKNVKLQNLQIMKANTLLSTKQIDLATLDLMGENPKQFEKTEEEKQEELRMLMQKTQAETPQVPAPAEMPGSNFQKANPIV